MEVEWLHELAIPAKLQHKNNKRRNFNRNYLAGIVKVVGTEGIVGAEIVELDPEPDPHDTNPSAAAATAMSFTNFIMILS